MNTGTYKLQIRSICLSDYNIENNGDKKYASDDKKETKTAVQV